MESWRFYINDITEKRYDGLKIKKIVSNSPCFLCAKENFSMKFVAEMAFAVFHPLLESTLHWMNRQDSACPNRTIFDNSCGRKYA